jgi:hypothetical protein
MVRWEGGAFKKIRFEKENGCAISVSVGGDQSPEIYMIKTCVQKQLNARFIIPAVGIIKDDYCIIFK